MLKFCVLHLILVYFLFGFCDASGLGSCPKYRSMQNFNVSEFTGNWYEIERSFYLLELATGCTTLEIEETRKGNLEVTAKAMNRWTGNRVTPSKGIAIPTKRDSSILKYQVNTILPNAIARFLPGSGTYQILHTDYNNYAILWSCSSMGIAHTDLIWILGRSREISAPVRAEIYSILSELEIDSDRLIISKNNNCPEFL